MCRHGRSGALLICTDHLILGSGVSSDIHFDGASPDHLCRIPRPETPHRLVSLHKTESRDLSGLCRWSVSILISIFAELQKLRIALGDLY
tara:strand:+ start:438 stop:707 length:270 start_codon:yes stop_codon:yes gene_type:complete